MKVTDLFHTKGCVAFEDAKRILGEAEYATARDMATAYLQGGGDWVLVVASAVAALDRESWWDAARLSFQSPHLPADVQRYARTLCLQNWRAARYACKQAYLSATTDSARAAAVAAKIAGSFASDVECMPRWDRRSRLSAGRSFAHYAKDADPASREKILEIIFEAMDEFAVYAAE